MEKIKPTLPFLEVMATQACNLSCLGCTNYSDLPQKGYPSWSDIEPEISAWTEKLTIPDFGIIGGEPLLNPDIENWILGIRKVLPDSQIRFTTNGLLLNKKFHIVEMLKDIGNTVFKITVHQNNQDIDNVIERVFGMYDWKPVREYGIDRWATEDGFRFQVNTPTKFLKTYRGNYKNMMPHKSKPKHAFDICIQQTCPLLYQGRIYKCSTSALLEDTLEKVGNPNQEHWQKYLNHSISVNSTDIEIQNFIDNFGLPHKMCSMCPTKNDKESIIDHLTNVTVKKQKIF